MTYQYDGTKWVRYSASVGAQGNTGSTGAQGAAGSSGSATLSNNAATRVITGGSGTNLQGETNFTFDGSRVRIEVQANASNASADSLQLGNNNNNHGLTILSATNAQGRIDFTDTVNTADPQGKVAYYHDSDSLQFFTNGASSSNERLRIASNGDATFSANITASGYIDSSSDLKLKTNIKTIDNALEKTLKLRGVEFDRIDKDDRQIGVIAQEVEKIIPEVVHGDETKSVTYGNLVGLLIEAIKELKKEIDELKLS